MRNVRALMIALTLVTCGYGASLSFVNTTNLGTTFVYRGSVQNNQEIRSGDYFAVFGFDGLDGGYVISGIGEWTYARGSELPTYGIDPMADAAFIYTGETIMGQSGHTEIGMFYLNSTFSGQKIGSYLSVSTRTRGGNTGAEVLGGGRIIVAAPEDAGEAVPEPNSLAFLVSGLVLMIVSAVRRHRRT